MSKNKYLLYKNKCMFSSLWYGLIDVATCLRLLIFLYPSIEKLAGIIEQVGKFIQN